MPKLPHKTPEGMCQKCHIKASWYKSDKNRCFWCHNELKESNGNQPLQRSAGVLSKSNTKSKVGNRKQSSSELDNVDSMETQREPSLNKQIARKQLKPAGWKPYPKSVKGLPHNGAK